MYHRCVSILPWPVHVRREAMAICALELHRFHIWPFQTSSHMDRMVQLDRAWISEPSAKQGKLRMLTAEPKHRLHITRSAIPELEVGMALRARLIGSALQVWRANMLDVTRSALRGECLVYLMCGRLMARETCRVFDVFAKAKLHQSSAYFRLMAGAALFAKDRMHRCHWAAGVRNVIFPYRHSHQPNYRNQRYAETDDGAPYAPGGPSLEVMEVVPLSEALSCAYASRHRLVPQGHHCVNGAHYQQCVG